MISFSIPVLVGLYPLAIVLVALSLLDDFWRSSARVFRPVMAVSLVFGEVDGNAAAGGSELIPSFFSALPMADQSLGWLIPVLLTLALAAGVDRLLYVPEKACPLTTFPTPTSRNAKTALKTKKRLVAVVRLQEEIS
jgi:LIVCS family branched-chain amino acid:cation transporter